ncbi:unnamed protein product [Vitrella brassicaformis CCMP3155]|uniref:Uncharacterized protein n=1 Tax=Vitrella brassicaformis (strain CCMP3155) TaxID=1169540 RepID=A0A0G4F1V8_VITBC|nr:unnamed protein product [Vitrella brassicaformis CCMP3155]|eukprot:CEM05738.1 unnamed protein product [Vitrella brassicaformis CCMP3155]
MELLFLSFQQDCQIVTRTTTTKARREASFPWVCEHDYQHAVTIVQQSSVPVGRWAFAGAAGDYGDLLPQLKQQKAMQFVWPFFVLRQFASVEAIIEVGRSPS